MVDFSIKTMEMVKNKWDQFGKNFEALSIWITEKEKELDTLETASSSLEMQISQIKVIGSRYVNIEMVFVLFPLQSSKGKKWPFNSCLTATNIYIYFEIKIPRWKVFQGFKIKWFVSLVYV